MIENFSKRLDAIFEAGDPTKARIIDAYIKSNQIILQPRYWVEMLGMARENNYTDKQTADEIIKTIKWKII